MVLFCVISVMLWLMIFGFVELLIVVEDGCMVDILIVCMSCVVV